MKLLEDDDLLFVARLSAVDVIEHPAREERAIGVVVARVDPLAANVAACRHMAVGRIDDLTHGDPHQELPELLATGRRRLAFELTGAEARVHALENVLLVLADANTVVQMSPHQRLQP